MRLHLILVSCTLFAISCSRTNQPTPQTNPNPAPVPDPPVPVVHVLPLLDSFKSYTLGPKEITSAVGKMIYDGSGRLTDIHETTTDSTEDRQPLRPDTLDFILTYQGADSLPTSYINYSAGLSTLAGRGFLRYDNQTRMTQDSGTNGQNTWLYKYQYTDGKIIQSSTYGTDSILIVNDNVKQWKEFLNIYSFTYSNYPNPFYQPHLAKHITPLMVFNSIDICSKNLFDSSTGQYVGNDPYLTTNYSWTANANGQVISGIGTDAKTGAILEYFWFTYK